MRFRFGTLGYSYADWQGPFYPAGMGSPQWLSFYASRFDAVEMNTTFHAQPTEGRVRGWASKVGPGFSFAVKTPRAITHDNPISQAVSPMADFVATLRSFGAALGPVLIQLAPHVTMEAFADVEKLLAGLPADVRFAVEFRHDSWVNDRATDLLREHRAAWVGLDHLDYPGLRRLRGTTDFLYVRLVGRHQRFPMVGQEQIDVTADLRRWHTAVRREIDNSSVGIREVWMMIGNDFAGFAPATIERYAKIAETPIGVAPIQNELFSRG